MREHPAISVFLPPTTREMIQRYKKTDQVFLRNILKNSNKVPEERQHVYRVPPDHSSLGTPFVRDAAEVTVVVNIVTPCESKGKRSSGEKMER